MPGDGDAGGAVVLETELASVGLGPTRRTWPARASAEEIGGAQLRGPEASCADGDDSDVGPSTETVWALPEVPSGEAIVATDANGRHGTIYRVDEEPAGDWDPALQVWLDRARVKKG